MPPNESAALPTYLTTTRPRERWPAAAAAVASPRLAADKDVTTAVDGGMEQLDAELLVDGFKKEGGEGRGGGRDQEMPMFCRHSTVATPDAAAESSADYIQRLVRERER